MHNLIFETDTTPPEALNVLVFYLFVISRLGVCASNSIFRGKKCVFGHI